MPKNLELKPRHLRKTILILIQEGLWKETGSSIPVRDKRKENSQVRTMGDGLY